MDNASDRKQINAARKAARLADQNDREVLATLASTEPGRAFLWRRLESANIFSTIFNDNPSRMAFNEGVRTAGLDLLNLWVQASPDSFILAMREHNGRSSESDASTQPDTGASGERSDSTESGRVDQGPGSESESFIEPRAEA